jgi:hypothetical protein
MSKKVVSENKISQLEQSEDNMPLFMGITTSAGLRVLIKIDKIVELECRFL